MGTRVEQLKIQSRQLASDDERLEKKVGYYETTTIKLVIAYIFFQAIIFLSVSHQHPASISCRHWWIPFSLSCLIFFIFAISFIRFARKWERIQNQHDITCVQRDSLHHKTQVLSTQRKDHQANTSDLESQGCSSENSNMYNQKQQQQPRKFKGDVVNVFQRNTFIYLVFCALIAYSVIILIACRFILCQSDATD